jgi:hypothetical protein
VYINEEGIEDSNLFGQLGNLKRTDGEHTPSIPPDSANEDRDSLVRRGI